MVLFFRYRFVFGSEYIFFYRELIFFTVSLFLFTWVDFRRFCEFNSLQYRLIFLFVFRELIFFCCNLFIIVFCRELIFSNREMTSFVVSCFFLAVSKFYLLPPQFDLFCLELFSLVWAWVNFVTAIFFCCNLIDLFPFLFSLFLCFFYSTVS